MLTIPAHDSFNFEGLLASSLEVEDYLDEHATDDEGEGPGDKAQDSLLSLSPLTTPENSPPTSPTIHTSILPIEIPPTPPNAPTPRTADLPSTNSALPPGNVPITSPTDSAMASKKRRGHNHRKRKREAERQESTPKDYETRPSTRRKHLPKEVVRTKFISEDAPISKAGFVGIRDERSSAVYSLKQLVGPKSRFRFDLVPWDGR